MRPTLAILILFVIGFLGSACGGPNNTTSTGAGNTSNTMTTTTDTTANTGTSNTNRSDTQGIGPHNQGIGGASDSNSNTRAINHNTKTEPPGVTTNSNGL